MDCCKQLLLSVMRVSTLLIQLGICSIKSYILFRILFVWDTQWLVGTSLHLGQKHYFLPTLPAYGLHESVSVRVSTQNYVQFPQPHIRCSLCVYWDLNYTNQFAQKRQQNVCYGKSCTDFVSVLPISTTSQSEQSV